MSVVWCYCWVSVVGCWCSSCGCVGPRAVSIVCDFERKVILTEKSTGLSYKSDGDGVGVGVNCYGRCRLFLTVLVSVSVSVTAVVKTIVFERLFLLKNIPYDLYEYNRSTQHVSSS